MTYGIYEHWFARIYTACVYMHPHIQALINTKYIPWHGIGDIDRIGTMISVNSWKIYMNLAIHVSVHWIFVKNKRTFFFAIHTSKIWDYACRFHVQCVAGWRIVQLMWKRVNIKEHKKTTATVFNFRLRASEFKHQGIFTILNRIQVYFSYANNVWYHMYTRIGLLWVF